MTPIRPLLVLALLVLGNPGAHAEYITDKLLVGFLEAPSAQAKVIKLLPSATPIEIREGLQGDFTQIRLSDGSEGWIETRYLTDEKPARSLVVELQAENAALQRRLSELTAAPKDSTPPDARTEARRIAELEALRSEARDLKRRLSEAELAAANSTAALQSELDRRHKAQATPATGEARGDDIGGIQRLHTENEELRGRIQTAAAALGTGVLAPPPEHDVNPLHLLIVTLALIVFFFVGFTFRGWVFSRRYPGFRI